PAAVQTGPPADGKPRPPGPPAGPRATGPNGTPYRQQTPPQRPPLRLPVEGPPQRGAAQRISRLAVIGRGDAELKAVVTPREDVVLHRHPRLHHPGPVGDVLIPARVQLADVGEEGGQPRQILGQGGGLILGGQVAGAEDLLPGLLAVV